MTDQQIIEWLAEFMGWHRGDFQKRAISTDRKRQSANYWYNDEGIEVANAHTDVFANIYHWDPLKDWNHWRQVEEMMLKSRKLFYAYLSAMKTICKRGMDHQEWLHKADLPTRCKALISVLDQND